MMRTLPRARCRRGGQGRSFGCPRAAALCRTAAAACSTQGGLVERLAAGPWHAPAHA